ncbi:helix-turn-helix domain-containing protein [Streptomyces sp900105755]|uniref:MarR family winged helix-turn-helix transcriptional regulator n=1 Tax=Streptomyces sp. 900105755 TaxID=3154389 RepID=UPI00332B2425
MHDDLHVLGRAVKQAQYRQHRAMDSALAAVGTTLAQWDALRAIDRSPGASARELAAATFQSEQAFGTLVGRLAAQGLVERRPGHGRRIRHHLTPEGERTLAAGHGVAGEGPPGCCAPRGPGAGGPLMVVLRRLNAQE